MNENTRIYEFGNNFYANHYLLPVGAVVQVNELSIRRGSEIKEHNQVCDEITYFISGKAEVNSADYCRIVQGGDIHFIKKGVKHSIVADKNENLRFICIGIDLNKDYEEIKDFNELNVEKFFYVKDDGNIKSLSELIVNELYVRDNNSDIMVNSYLTQIFITLARLYNLKEKLKKNYSNTSTNQTFYNILKFVDREYMSLKTVRQISKRLAYSEDYISHLFKEKMGITVKEYLIRKKIMGAIDLLETTDLKMEEIAEYLSFSSAHTFYQAFKRIMNISPTDYKKQITDFRL